jgi:hypothetical protein
MAYRICYVMLSFVFCFEVFAMQQLKANIRLPGAVVVIANQPFAFGLSRKY